MNSGDRHAREDNKKQNARRKRLMRVEGILSL
jgi:hypothetical protein